MSFNEDGFTWGVDLFFIMILVLLKHCVTVIKIDGDKENVAYIYWSGRSS